MFTFCLLQDLDAYHDDEDYDREEDREHYYAAAPSGWDDPGNNEVPPFYNHAEDDLQGYRQGPNVNREGSFVSSAMFVWEHPALWEDIHYLLVCKYVCMYVRPMNNWTLSDVNILMPWIFSNLLWRDWESCFLLLIWDVTCSLYSEIIRFCSVGLFFFF